LPPAESPDEPKQQRRFIRRALAGAIPRVAPQTPPVALLTLVTNADTIPRQRARRGATGRAQSICSASSV